MAAPLTSPRFLGAAFLAVTCAAGSPARVAAQASPPPGTPPAAAPTRATAKPRPRAARRRAPKGPEAQLWGAARRMREALVIQDTSALGQLWSDEYTFTATTGTMLTREQRLAAVMQPGFSPDDQPDALPPHEADVQLLGTVAVVRARTSSARLLTVWVRRKGRWQVVASQASSVAARPSTR